MRLPALDPRERIWLQARLPGSTLPAFARRLQQRLIASLGVPVGICELPGGEAQGAAAPDEPVIAVQPELAAAWLALRLGGKAGAGLPLRDGALAAPLRALIRRTLAEAVINSGETAWPQAMRLSVAMGGQQGIVEIFWNGAHALAWARRAMREKA